MSSLRIEYLANRTFLRSSDIGEITELYERYIQICERVFTSDYYHYRVNNSPDMEGETTPFILGEALNAFYFQSSSVIVQFRNAQDRLLMQGVSSVRREEEINSSRMLADTYSLIEAYLGFLGSKATLPKGFAQLSGLQQTKLNKAVNSIPTNKPDSVKETLRRYLPRWTTQAINVSELLDILETDWIYFLRDKYKPKTLELISSEDLDVGKLPIHVLMELGHLSAKEGFRDAGYRLQTRAIIHILQEEQSANTGDNPEIPFFTSILPGLIRESQKQKIKGTFFDFQASISALMIETCIRLREELQSEESGDALEFLNTLEQMFPDEFLDLLVTVLARESKRTGGVDVIQILRLLPRLNTFGGEEVIHRFQSLSDRPVLNTEEIEELSQIFSDSKESGLENSFLSSVEELLDGQDNLELSFSLHDLGIELSANRVGHLEVEIDKISQMLTCNLFIQDRDMIRRIAWKSSFLGEVQQLEIPSIDATEPAAVIKGRYLFLVGKAITVELQNRRDRLMVQPRPHSNTYPVQERVLLTRDERVERYKLAKANALRKRRKDKSLDGVTDEVMLIEDNVDDVEASKVLWNADVDTIRQFLNAARIQVVSAEVLHRKLEHVVVMSSVSKQMLGHRLPLDSVVRFPDDINIRCVSFVLNNGRSTVNVYIEDLGNGTFKMKGIYLFKNDAELQRYVLGLLSQQNGAKTKNERKLRQ